MMSPCKECPDRFLGCHSTCKRYLTFKESYEHFKEEKYKQEELERSLRLIHSKRRGEY